MMRHLSQERSMSSDPALFTDGEAYERRMGRWSAMVGKDFVDWLAQPKGLAWLDAGCGTGAFTEVIMANAGPSAVTGIDPSPDQITYAKSRPGTASASYHVGDAQALLFDANAFDVAAMALVIAFVPEPARAVAEMRRVVKPGGTVAAYMWDLPGGGLPFYPIYGAMKSMNLTAPMPPSMDALRREVMEQLWRDAGLEAIETEVFRIPVTFTSFDEFWTANTLPVGPLGKYIETLDADTKQDLQTRLEQRLTRGPSGSIAYEAFANAVRGRVSV
jgi:ubiquinone/menaquinone biosynthesis C-methylase UbiE